MLAKMYANALCLLVLFVASHCLGVDLYIYNCTDIPLKITALRGSVSLTDVSIAVPAKGHVLIGCLRCQRNSKVERITEITVNEGWSSWIGRQMYREKLPQFSALNLQQLDTILTQLKNKAARASQKQDYVIEIGLNENRDFTFRVNIIGEWVNVHK